MEASERTGEKVLEAQREEAERERKYMEAVILLSTQIPKLIRELQYLRGSIDKMHR